jgi:cell division protein FtsI/penicillin-binding protein 2
MSRIGWDRPEDREEPVEDIALRGRLYFFRILVIIIFALLLYRVYHIQQTRGQSLTVLAQQNQFATLRADAPRGVIFDYACLFAER